MYDCQVLSMSGIK